MALAAFNGQALDLSGNVITDFQVEVRREIAGAPLASIFSDRDGVTPLGNPFTPSPDDNGRFRFHVVGGAYRVRVFTSGGFEAIWRYVGVGTAGETDAGAVPTLMLPTVWAFDDATADADPGSGLFRLNHATPASATAAYIDNLNADGEDVSAWLDTLDDGGDTADRGKMTIFLPDAPTEFFQVYTVSGSVVDGTGYRKLTLAHVAGAGALVADAQYGISFAPKGLQGDVPSSRTLTAGAGLTGGGTLAADRTFAVGAGTGIVANADDVAIDKASDANVRAAASNKVLTADLIESASARQTLTETAGAIAIDWDAFVFADVNIDENSTLSNPTNGQPGTWRYLRVIGDGATPRTLSFGNQYFGDLPTLDDITLTKHYLVMILCVTSTNFILKATQSTP